MMMFQNYIKMATLNVATAFKEKIVLKNIFIICI